MTNEKTRYRVVKNMGKYSLQRYIEPKTVEYYDTVRYWWGKRRELIKRNMKGEWAWLRDESANWREFNTIEEAVKYAEEVNEFSEVVKEFEFPMHLS